MMVMSEASTMAAMTSFFMMMYMFNKYHVMNNLIICEYMVASMMIIIFTTTNMLKLENYVVLFVLVIMISESVVGLCLMVNLIRTHSNDFMKSMTMMKF